MRHSLPALVTALLVGLAHAQNDDDDSSSSRSCTTGCEPKPFGSSGMMITSCKCYATAECVDDTCVMAGWLIAVIVIVVLCCCGCCVGGGIWYFKRRKRGGDADHRAAQDNNAAEHGAAQAPAPSPAQRGRKGQQRCGPDLSDQSLRRIRDGTKWLTALSLLGSIIAWGLFLGVASNLVYESTLPFVNSDSSVVFTLTVGGLACLPNADAKADTIVSVASQALSPETCKTILTVYTALGCSLGEAAAMGCMNIFSDCEPASKTFRQCDDFQADIGNAAKYAGITNICLILHLCLRMFSMCCCHPGRGKWSTSITSLGLIIAAIVCYPMYRAAFVAASEEPLFTSSGVAAAASGLSAVSDSVSAGISSLISYRTGVDKFFPEATGTGPADGYITMLVLLVLIPESLICVCAFVLPEDIKDRPEPGAAAVAASGPTSAVARQITLSPHGTGMNTNPLATNNPAFVTQESSTDEPPSSSTAAQPGVTPLQPFLAELGLLGVGNVLANEGIEDIETLSLYSQAELEGAGIKGGHAKRLLAQCAAVNVAPSGLDAYPEPVAPNTNCAYVSDTGRTCSSNAPLYKPAMQWYSQYCVNHTCKMPTCALQRSSRDDHCTEHFD